ncbi:FAD-dependent monooxygenase [Nitrospira japonica]
MAVVGAGGGGAVLALAIAQKGIRTVVLDQAPGPPQGLRGEILHRTGRRCWIGSVCCNPCRPSSEPTGRFRRYGERWLTR